MTESLKSRRTCFSKTEGHNRSKVSVTGAHLRFFLMAGWPRAMSCHVMASRAMPGHIFACHAIFLSVMPCHEYSIPCHVSFFWDKYVLKNIKKDMPVLCQEYNIMYMLFFYAEIWGPLSLPCFFCMLRYAEIC